MRYRFFLLILFILITSTVAGQMNIISTLPSINANYVPRDSDIEITFDDTIDPGTLDNSTIIVRGIQSGRISGTLSGGGTPTVVFDPDVDFKAGDVLSVTVTDQLVSQIGLPLARGTTFSFTAIVDPPPALPMTFAQRNIQYKNEVQTEDIKTFDYDYDGDLDLLTATEGIPELTFFLENDGNQNFTSTRLGAEFRFVEIHDIDGDGDFDSFGATGSFDTELNWFENEGAIPFTEQFISSVDPWTLTGGDLDSDGDIDALAAVLPSNVAWFANDGLGVFTQQPNIPTTFSGGSDSFFEIVDVNSDGAMDILAFHEDDFNLVWYQNDGNQNFTENLIENTPTLRIRPSIGDIDDDGDMDIFAASVSTGGELFWYQNDGSQNFTKIPIPATATQLFQTWVVDLDGDLDMDIISGRFWYENDGSESFTEHIIMEAPNYTKSINYGDVDSDGDMDLVTIGRLRWFENGMFMNLTSITPNNGTTGVSTSPVSMTFDQPIDATTLNPDNIWVSSDLRGELSGTLNGGGTNTISWVPSTGFLPGEEITVSINVRLKSLSGHSLTHSYGINFTTESGALDPTFNPVPVFTHSGTTTSVDLADMDGDGDLDMITSSFNELFWHENDGNGNFTQIPIVITSAPSRIFATDQNGDGSMDIIVDQGGFDDTILYLNDGSQNFTESSLGAGLIDVFQTGDVNFDGDEDVTWLSAQFDGVGWADVLPDGGYAPSGRDIPEIASRDVRSRDMDGDGDTDFVAVSFGGTDFYQNDGFFNFPNTNINATNATDVILADLDGDQDYDPVVLESGTIVWYENRLNEGTNDFNTKQVITTLATDPRVFIAADMDGDGDPDIVVTSENDDIIAWQENRLDEGTNDFSSEIINSGTSDRPQALAAGDLDGDGDLDLVVLSRNDNEVTIYRNSPSACVPISITTQPVSADICVGDAYSLTVDATGEATITYQWQKDNTDIPGATSNTFTIPSAALADEGDYQCILTNPCGNETTNSVTITVFEPVAITVQPQSQVIMDGSDVMLSVTATGTSPTYQWQKDGSDIPGAINPTLDISPFSASDEGNYTCIVDNFCNSETSNVAILTLLAGNLGFSVQDSQTSQQLNNGQQNPVDFGIFNLQETAERDFEIENTGGPLIMISSITSSDQAFSVSNVPTSVSDLIETFTVSMNTFSAGIFESDILIITDAGNFLFPVSGEVTDSPVTGDLVIYNGLAPDGDGRNDYFKIENIELFSPNRVEIYNRWGNKVFEINGYDNQVSDRRFEGISNVGESKDLVEGSYFYVISFQDKRQSGSLFLRR